MTGTLRLDPNLDLSNAASIYHVRAINSHLILSSSVGSTVTVSGSFYASGSAHVMTGTLRLDPNLDLSNAASTYHVRAVNSHLVLSSSAGSFITISSSFRSSGYASASLPDPNTVPSGAITYVTDMQAPAIADKGSWHRLLTGSL